MIDPTLLVIERIHHYRDTIRKYHVEIDGERVCAVRDNDHGVFEVAPGQHSVRLKLMWISSPIYLCEAIPGAETRLWCGPNGGLAQAWRLFLAPRTAIFLRGSLGPDDLVDRPGHPDDDALTSPEAEPES